MNTLISIALLISSLFCIVIFLWLLARFLQLYVFGLQRRHISARLNALEIQTAGFSWTIPRNQAQDEPISIFYQLDQLPLIKGLKRHLDKAGLTIQASRLFLSMIGAGMIFAILVLTLTGSLGIGLVSGIILGILPYGVLLFIVQRRQAILQNQLPDLMDFMARSLQVGHSLNNTLKMAAADAPMPISAEFQRIFEELNYGSPIQKVLAGLTQRIDCAEIRYFVIAVIVNREIGGDLAEILKRVSKLIRERMDMQQTVRVLTSEGRASALVLGALPFVIAGLIYFIQPNSYELMLNDALGQNLLLYASLSMIIGFIWMKQMCTLKQ